MAEDNLQTGDAHANELGKLAGETLQQYADRLLEAKRLLNTDPAARPQIINRPALNRLELGGCELSYVNALNNAIADTINHIRGLVAPSGVRADPNLLAFVLRADTLLCLQQDRCMAAEDHVRAGVDGWPTTGHPL